MGLKDKASKINFGMLSAPALPVAPAPVPAPGSGEDLSRRPKTGPGVMMAFANDARSSMLEENERLRGEVQKVDELRGKLNEALADLDQWKDTKVARLIDAARIRRSRYANRHELSFLGQDFEALKAEIREAGGNVQPIKVRALGGTGSEAEYEIVFGHRRHEACRQLGLPVLAMVDNLDDRALFVEMERENRARADLSAWEQGVMYKRALDSGLYPSNKQLALAIGLDVGAVGKALSLAELPIEVIDAFGSPLNLQYRFSKPLKDALAVDRKAVISRAKAILAKDLELSPKEILSELLGVQAKSAEAPRTRTTSTRVVQAGGHRASIESEVDGSVRVVFPAGSVDASRLKDLEQAVLDFLNRSV